MQRPTKPSNSLAASPALATDPVRRHRTTPAALRRYGVPYALLAPTLFCLLAVVGYPLLTIVIESLHSVEPLQHPGWVFIGLENYTRLLQDTALWGAAQRTFIWTFGSVAAQLLLALALALVLREPFRGRGLLRALLVIPWATPAVVGAMAWKWLYHGQYGLINTAVRTLGRTDVALAWLGDPQTALGAAIVANIWRGFPFLMVMLLAGLLTIPEELYEAAVVDGASYGQRVYYITLPLLRPTIVVSTLLASIWTFNNFSAIFVLTGGGPAGTTEIMVTYIYRNGFQHFHFGYAAALSVVLFGLVLGAAGYVLIVGRTATNDTE